MLNTPENMYRLMILFEMYNFHEEALHFSVRMLAQALYFSQFAFNAVYLALFVFDKSTRSKSYFEHSTNSMPLGQSSQKSQLLSNGSRSKMTRLIKEKIEKRPSKLTLSRFIFDVRINIPAQMLRQEECRVPFILAHGPRSLEFEFKINVADFRKENPTLLVDCQNELRMQISGLIAIRFGASKDINNTVDTEVIMNEMEETDFEHTFIIRGIDPFLESLHNIITSTKYENGLIGFSILITYQETEFMQFVQQKNRLRPFTYTEIWNCQLNIKAYRDFKVYGSDAYSIMYSKWILYMSTKYFHKLIDENPNINQATLNYPHDVIIHAISLALKNQFQQEYNKNIRKMCQIIELLCILEPINVDIAIENVAIELQCSIFDEWKYVDLDDLVRILTLPKYWELEELKVAARSVIIDLHGKQFQKEYNEQSTGERCAMYRELISSGALDETSKPVESELAKIKRMSWKMSTVKKTVEFFDESISQ